MNAQERGTHDEAVSTEGAPTEQQRQFVRLNEIIAEQVKGNGSLIAVLQAVQKEYRYLPEEVLTYVATALGLSPANVFGVATFYAQFSLQPKGRYVVTVCDGTACHVKRSIPIYEAIRRHLGLEDGESTTRDMLFTVETVACVGACGLAPVMVVNGKVYGELTPDKAVAVIAEWAARKEEK